jgi:hypothetical protein
MLRLAACALLVPAAAAVVSAEDLYAPWEELLARFTVERAGNVLVRYAALKSDRVLLDRFVDMLARTRPETLPDDNARKALWINAYNAFAIKACVEHYPLGSIRDLGSIFSPVWDRRWFTVGGEKVSLGHIEHEVLRRQFADARIHAAIVCASMSCPNLARVPYRPAMLDAQLDEAMQGWIKSPKGARLDREAKVLWLSSIFKWFAADLNPDGLRVPAVVTRWLPESDRGLLANPELAVRYLDYDWSINAAE